ncbi:GDSL esterase/lipase At4g10955 [Lolium perenne]|uniref:GDSL esterase/lipase At4g10955 n=1 Tax=Lolium perenne TaxID=4522 RepID=UPI0021E9EF44|nr:GDSL esterase/lipase At4g10955-like [Lolium perenne]
MDQDDEDDFEVSGPNHMRTRSRIGRRWKIVIDWQNPEHVRCVVACLVKGTGVMERDRIKCRTDTEALAPPWWESFGFIRHKVFKTESIINDHFTYGAIFQPREPSRCPYAPKYVVAFRGTMLFHPKVLQDLMQDALVLFNALADNRRFKRTHVHVEELIGSNPVGSVWLAGHSLGASLALEIGRNIMLKKGVSVPTFLFNPPHVSPAPVINNLPEEHKTVLHTGSYAVKFVLSNVVPGHRKRTKKLFRQLAPWVPELYVNPDDAICLGYIDYFVQRERVYEKHPRFASTATRTSYRDILFFRTLRSHLLPSARLWTNSRHKTGAHGLRQWWKPDSELALSNTRYVCPLN